MMRLYDFQERYQFPLHLLFVKLGFLEILLLNTLYTLFI